MYRTVYWGYLMQCICTRYMGGLTYSLSTYIMNSWFNALFMQGDNFFYFHKANKFVKSNFYESFWKECACVWFIMFQNVGLLHHQIIYCSMYVELLVSQILSECSNNAIGGTSNWYISVLFEKKSMLSV